MTSAEPWTLTTAPGTSGYTMYRDPDADPPALVCQVGKTTLRYHLSAVEDLHAWLLAQGDWVPLGAADEQKPAAEGSVEAWGRSADNPVGGWYGLRKGYRGRFGMYLPPLLEHLGLAELTHDARNNKVRRAVASLSMAGDISIDLGEALGTDFFTVREQFTDEQWDRFITTRRFVDNEVLPVVADYWERAELAWPLIRRLPELGIVGEGIKGYGARRDEPDGVRAGAHGAAPRRRQPGHVPRRARGPGHAVDRDVRLGGAEGPLAAVHVDDGEDRRLRAHRARPRLGLDRAGHHRPPRRRPLGAGRGQAVDRQRAPSPTSSSSGPATPRTARSRASSWRRPPRATRPR